MGWKNGSKGEHTASFLVVTTGTRMRKRRKEKLGRSAKLHLFSSTDIQVALLTPKGAVDPNVSETSYKAYNYRFIYTQNCFCYTTNYHTLQVKKWVFLYHLKTILSTAHLIK